jgi:hypothetical protein
MRLSVRLDPNHRVVTRSLPKVFYGVVFSGAAGRHSPAAMDTEASLVNIRNVSVSHRYNCTVVSV